MKRKTTTIIQGCIKAAFMCLVTLAYMTVNAASPITQKGPPSVNSLAPAAVPAAIKYDPNAPPKGTIIINASDKANVNASTVMPGSYQYIQWTCNGTLSNLVDVTLWRNNVKVLVIGTGIATGQIAYKVPLNMAMGNYEYRITSAGDARVEARRQVSIASSITITKPAQGEVLNMEANYETTWSYLGDPGPVVVSYQNENGCNKIIARSDQPAGNLPQIVIANGQGKVTWAPKPIDDCFSSNPKTSNYRIFVKSAANPQVSGTSALFSIPCKYALCGNWQVCTNLQTNPQNCGKCGNNCAIISGSYANQCVNGKCQCPAGRIECQGKHYPQCVDLKTDKEHCGACGRKCDPYGTFPDCVSSTCICAPPQHTLCPTPTPGKLKCVDLKYDSNNCGKCDNKCPAATPYCENSACKAYHSNQPPDLNTVLPSPLSN